MSDMGVSAVRPSGYEKKAGGMRHWYPLDPSCISQVRIFRTVSITKKLRKIFSFATLRLTLKVVSKSTGVFSRCCGPTLHA